MNETPLPRRRFLSLAAQGALAGAATLSGARLILAAPIAKPANTQEKQLPAAQRVASKAERPNIVLILADDMGYSDIGCFGSEIATPNIDRLAREGLRCPQFYNVARCCPTRAALLSGLYPHQAGIGHMIDDYAKDIRARLNSPAYTDHLSSQCVTLAEVLRGAGYRTLMSGKWHVGRDRPHWPVDRGFDRYYGVIGGASNYFDPAPNSFALDDKPLDAGGPGYYTTDAFTDYSLRFLEETRGNKEQPFFLYQAYTAPHWPLHARREDIAKYRGRYKKGWDVLREERLRRQIASGISRKEWEMAPRDARVPAWESEADQDLFDLKMAVYAAQVDRMDQNIGRLLAKLDEMGVRDNTLVFFLSDNGACAELIHRSREGALPGVRLSFESYGIGWANLGSTPFRLYKHWTHEGGIATPLIACWPKTIRAGGLRHEPGHVIDIMATCVDVAGATYPTQRNGKAVPAMEGTSLRPLFEGKALQRPTPLFWEHEGNRAVRDGRWKLVSRFNTGNAWELYDMEADRTEMHNLASAQPQRVQTMSAQYESWAKRCGVLPWEQAEPSRGVAKSSRGKK
ncbi:MAG: arylsulfatase [Armatimonadetes bacterium]|nr:arylsulfatase [Armatimonadota bacterium]